MQAVCCVCKYFNDVDEDAREIVCANCYTALMVYEDGSTEPMGRRCGVGSSNSERSAEAIAPSG